MLMNRYSLSNLNKPLSCKFDFSKCFAFLPASFACTNRDTVTEFDFVFLIRKRAGTMMREMHTAQSARAEISVAHR